MTLIFHRIFSRWQARRISTNHHHIASRSRVVSTFWLTGAMGCLGIIRLERVPSIAGREISGDGPEPAVRLLMKVVKNFCCLLIGGEEDDELLSVRGDFKSLAE